LSLSADYVPNIRIIGYGTGSRLYIATGTGVEAISLHNVSVVFEGLTFLGNIEPIGEVPALATDCKRVLDISATIEPANLTIRDCEFYGIGTADEDGAIIAVDRMMAQIQNVHLYGCSTSSGVGGFNIRATRMQSLLYENSSQWDFGYLDGVYHYKTGILTAGACIAVIDTNHTPEAEVSAPTLVNLRNLYLNNEGCAEQIKVQCGLSAHWPLVNIEDVAFTCPEIGGETAIAIKVLRANHVDINRVFFTWQGAPGGHATGGDRAAISLQEVDEATIRKALCRYDYNIIRANDVDTLTIHDDCEYETLDLTDVTTTRQPSYEAIP
jgi:hypothetical protein